MLQDKSSGKHKEHPEEYHQEVQKPVKILKTSKADNTRNPLHGDLSGKPEDENKAVHDQDKNSKD
jgi:hypothetical protein